MSETTNNPQPSEPPVSGSGTGTAPNIPTDDDVELPDDAISDPPTSGGGGGGS